MDAFCAGERGIRMHMYAVCTARRGKRERVELTSHRHVAVTSTPLQDEENRVRLPGSARCRLSMARFNQACQLLLGVYGKFHSLRVHWIIFFVAVRLVYAVRASDTRYVEYLNCNRLIIVDIGASFGKCSSPPFPSSRASLWLIMRI